MPINPNIALSFKPTYELEPPQNILANVMRLKGAEQEQQMNALRMQEAQRGVESQNALNRALSAAYDPTTGRPNVSKATAELAGSGFGGQIPGVLKSEAERVEAENKSQESRSKLLGSKLAQSKDALEQYVKTPEQMRQYNAANIADPVIGEYMRSRGITLDQLNQEVDAVEAAGTQANNRYLQKQVLGAKEFLKANEGKLYFPHGSDNAYVYNPYEGTVAQVPGLNTGASQRITPYQQQSLAMQERLAGQGVTYQTDANGNLIALPSKMQAGGAPVATPVTGAEGAPVKAKLSPLAEKTKIQRAQMSKDIDLAITEIGNAIKPGGTLEKATASGVGRLVDKAAAFVGKDTPGSIAADELRPIADLVLKMVPRFEGSQSNDDRKSYEQASGQLANESLPIERRKAAAEVVLRLLKTRKNQFVSQSMAAEGVEPSAPAKPLNGVVDFGSLK